VPRHSDGCRSLRSPSCGVETRRSCSESMPGTTAGAPEFLVLNSKAGEILSKSPQYTPSFFFVYIHCTCGRALTPYRINLFARDIYAPACRRMDDRGSVKHLCLGNQGCLTYS
jgi:hypothetical protein